MFVLEYIVEITCIFLKDISEDPSCVVWPRVQSFQIVIHLELSGKGFLEFFVFCFYCVLITFKN